MKLQITDIATESYEHLGARLFHLCRIYSKEHTSTNVAIAFSERDCGTGNASLWLTKHFSAFPVEVGQRNGEVNLRELQRIMQQPGMTLLIQGLPLTEQGPQKTKTDIPYPPLHDIEVPTEGNVLNLLPHLVGLKDPDAQTSAQHLFHQISITSRFLAEISADDSRPLIYIAGFNLVEPSPPTNKLPFVDFLPWYLFLRDGQGNTRIYMQPELEQFLLELPTDNSHLISLEALFDDTESDGSTD